MAAEDELLAELIKLRKAPGPLTPQKLVEFPRLIELMGFRDAGVTYNQIDQFLKIGKVNGDRDLEILSLVLNAPGNVGDKFGAANVELAIRLHGTDEKAPDDYATIRRATDRALRKIAQFSLRHDLNYLGAAIAVLLTGSEALGATLRAVISHPVNELMSPTVSLSALGELVDVPLRDATDHDDPINFVAFEVGPLVTSLPMCGGGLSRYLLRALELEIFWNDVIRPDVWVDSTFRSDHYRLSVHQGRGWLNVALMNGAYNYPKWRHEEEDRC